MASTTPSDQNGMSDQERVERALALLAIADAKEAEKAAKKAKREAERSAPDYVAPPNASHVFLRKYVDSVNAANTAFDGDDAQFRSYIMSTLAFVDTAARGSNLTTARDFEVMGNLIETTRPTVPTP